MDFRVPLVGLKSPKLSAQAIQEGLLGDTGDMPFLDPMVLLRSNPKAAVGSIGDEATWCGNISSDSFTAGRTFALKSSSFNLGRDNMHERS